MAKCPICSTFVPNTEFLEKYISPFNNHEYKLYHCPNCDLQWWEPLKMIPEFYENETFEMYKTFHLGIRKKLPYYQEYFFKHIPIKKGKLLDIGCGDGLFLEHAQRFGFDVYGIDIDRNSVKIARKRLKSNKVYSMSLEDFTKYARQKNLKFDVITFFEVLEHQDNPKVFLENIKQLLKPNAYIAGSVPNRASIFQKKINREVYKYIDHPPHHFLRFSAKSLKEILYRFSFKNVNVVIPEMPYEDIAYLVQETYLGRILRKPKKFIKGILLRMARHNNTNEIIESNIDVITPKVRVFQFVRNILLIPIVLFFKVKFPNYGVHLYFQASKIEK